MSARGREASLPQPFGCDGATTRQSADLAVRAVSVAANLCTVAGSIATIAMLKDEPEAIKWLNDLEVPFVAMDSNLSMLRNSD